MNYLWRYETPKGFDDMWMSGDGEVLTGLWFDGSKDTGKHQRQGEEQLLPVFKETIRWLDTYFAGGVPDFTPVFHRESDGLPPGSTGDYAGNTLWENRNLWGYCPGNRRETRNRKDVCPGGRRCSGSQSHLHYRTLPQSHGSRRKDNRLRRRN